MTYAKEQAKNILPYWPEEAEWFIVGGPADANEAQTIYKHYPDITYIGFEPNRDFVKVQEANHFPGIVYPYALWDRQGLLPLEVQTERPRGASLCPPDREASGDLVSCFTLDLLSRKYGPFTNSVLWIDIEYAELRALQGAKGMLERGDILLINLEAFDHHKDVTNGRLTLPAIADFLAQYKLEEVHRWNSAQQGGRHDVIFKLQE